MQAQHDQTFLRLPTCDLERPAYTLASHGLPVQHQISVHLIMQVWVRPSAEMQFLYGNHVLKSGLGRITEGTPAYTGVVRCSTSWSIATCPQPPLLHRASVELCAAHEPACLRGTCRGQCCSQLPAADGTA